MEKQLLDLETALERLGGDKEFLVELLEELVQQIDQSLPELKAAVEAQNFDEVRSLAHGMKGAAANLGADQATEIFLQLEMMGKNHDLSGAAEALATAQKLNEALKERIKSL